MESLNIPTESEQMYLVSMARLAEIVDECPIPVTQVAELLGVTSISANQMIHNLDEMGLVTYTPYKGVEFTEQGWQAAANILRNRRLWEVFLVEKLQYDPQEAETVACRLEHGISDETSQRLAEFLGWPEVSPQGKPIPQLDQVGILQSGSPLNILAANERGVVTAILAGEEERVYLEQSGVQVGSQISVLASQQDGPCLIKTGKGTTINISADLSKSIWVNPVSSK
jgi:DtxR family Mn-dependent transcriptional regulator